MDWNVALVTFDLSVSVVIYILFLNPIAERLCNHQRRCIAMVIRQNGASHKVKGSVGSQTSRSRGLLSFHTPDLHDVVKCLPTMSEQEHKCHS